MVARSRRITRRPSRAARYAVVTPAIPPPITQTSALASSRNGSNEIGSVVSFQSESERSVLFIPGCFSRGVGDASAVATIGFAGAGRARISDQLHEGSGLERRDKRNLREGIPRNGGRSRRSGRRIEFSCRGGS